MWKLRGKVGSRADRNGARRGQATVTTRRQAEAARDPAEGGTRRGWGGVDGFMSWKTTWAREKLFRYVLGWGWACLLWQ